MQLDIGEPLGKVSADRSEETQQRTETRRNHEAEVRGRFERFYTAALTLEEMGEIDLVPQLVRWSAPYLNLYVILGLDFNETALQQLLEEVDSNVHDGARGPVYETLSSILKTELPVEFQLIREVRSDCFEVMDSPEK